jgi:hypothetical protein
VQVLGFSCGFGEIIWESSRFLLVSAAICILCGRGRVYDIARVGFAAGPWRHAVYAGVGAVVGYNCVQWESDLLVKVNELRVKKGFQPISRKSLLPELTKVEP